MQREGALDGIAELDSRWCFKAAVGLQAQEESMTEMSSPSLLVFKCGILKLQYVILFDVMPYLIAVKRAT